MGAKGGVAGGGGEEEVGVFGAYDCVGVSRNEDGSVAGTMEEVRGTVKQAAMAIG